jgi:hypothetical protein
VKATALSIMAHKVANPIVISADTVNRAFCPLSSAKLAELVPGCAGKHVQQIQLIVLKIGALPDLEQMRSNRKIAFAGRLAELQYHHDGARNKGDGRDYRRDCGCNLPVDRVHSSLTLIKRESRSNVATAPTARPRVCRRLG